jgi:THO complex subunit 5
MRAGYFAYAMEWNESHTGSWCCWFLELSPQIPFTGKSCYPSTKDRVKSETENEKIHVDHTTLQLHNLMYEKNHYLKTIKACKYFKSKYPDIELVPEEEFCRDTPEELKGDPLSKEDPHKRMLHRLNFELFQRKELCKQQEELEQRKKNLQETIANRKKFISSLPSHLKSLKKASLPVQ